MKNILNENIGLINSFRNEMGVAPLQNEGIPVTAQGQVLVKFDELVKIAAEKNDHLILGDTDHKVDIWAQVAKPEVMQAMKDGGIKNMIIESDDVLQPYVETIYNSNDPAEITTAKNEVLNYLKKDLNFGTDELKQQAAQSAVRLMELGKENGVHIHCVDAQAKITTENPEMNKLWRESTKSAEGTSTEVVKEYVESVYKKAKSGAELGQVEKAFFDGIEKDDKDLHKKLVDGDFESLSADEKNYVQGSAFMGVFDYEEGILKERDLKDGEIAKKMNDLSAEGKTAILYGSYHFTRGNEQSPDIHDQLSGKSTSIALVNSDDQTYKGLSEQMDYVADFRNSTITIPPESMDRVLKSGDVIVQQSNDVQMNNNIALPAQQLQPDSLQKQ